MPAQTVIQVRRDTAANWSSANPTLANGEMGYDTTNKLFKVGDGSTAWNSLPVMAQHNTGSAARPLLTGGAYLSGSGLVLSGLADNYASAPDSAALSITGDIDIKVKVALTDWTPAGTNAFAIKGNSNNTQVSYRFESDFGSTGKLRFRWSTDGTTVIQQTSDNLGLTDGATKWVRVTLDVDNGAGGYALKFYTSDNGTTWTQVGSTITGGSTTSIFDGTAVLGLGATSDNSAHMSGTIYRTIIQSAYDTADNTTSLQFDANFETATADALAFTESSSNAATVTINTTRYSVGIPNGQVYATGTGNYSASMWYQPFIVNQAIVVDLLATQIATAPGSNTDVRVGIYNADNNFQPTTLVVDAGTFSALSGSNNATYSIQFTPVTLQPGNYLIATKPSGTVNFRNYRGGLVVMNFPSIGTSPFRINYNVAQSAGAFPSTGAVWTTSFASSSGQDYLTLLRWKAA